MKTTPNVNQEMAEPYENSVIENSKLNHLYSHDFGKGRYFQVISLDNNGFDIKISPRISFKVVYIKENEKITQFEIIKLNNKREKQKLSLSKFGFSQMVAFLKLITKIDLKGITERRIKLVDSELENINDDTKRKIITLLSNGDEGTNIIEECLNSGAVTSKDIVNIGYRKEQLNIFKDQLKAREWKENDWQNFFKKNEWIFGYGLRYQFLSLVTEQPIYDGANYRGFGEQRGDYLMNSEAKKKFTVLVEIKKPQTEIVLNKEYRAKTWKLGNELLWATSQIQTNCVSWFRDGSRQECAKDELEDRQIYTYQPKGILVIGHTDQLDERIKLQTFEAYRRELHNPEIITFDELYERASFIVEQGKKD